VLLAIVQSSRNYLLMLTHVQARSMIEI